MRDRPARRGGRSRWRVLVDSRAAHRSSRSSSISLRTILRPEVLLDGAIGLGKVSAGHSGKVTDAEIIGLEAIIALEGRPALFIKGDDFFRGARAVADTHHRARRYPGLDRAGRPDRGHRAPGQLTPAAPDRVVTAHPRSRAPAPVSSGFQKVTLTWCLAASNVRSPLG